MADEIAAAPIAESPAPTSAPAASDTPTPVATEAVPSAAAPAPAAEPAPAPAAPAAVEAPKPDAAPAAPAAATPSTEPASLLGDAAQPAPEPKAEAKPEGDKPAADAKPEGEAPATEEARPEEAPLPSYDVFTVPEGVELEDANVDRFVGSLGAFEREINPNGDPAVHAKVQQFAQGLLDQYTEEVAQLGERIAQVNAETFNRTMENWKEQVFTDPELGGNRKDTTLRAAGAVISRFGGSAQQIAELRQVLASTGAGNNISVIRFVNNIASFLQEPSPVPATKPEPQQMSRTERRYGKK